jgi:DNA-binding response OmpR family regulator
MLLKKIVIAEDDDAIAHMINMALGDAGFLCLRASNGEEALNLVRLHTPDLLVLDVMMPRMDGKEVARRLKSDVLLSRTPILMLTALSTVDDKIHGIDSGADAYMVKPFDLRELSAQVKALIRATTRERDRNPTTNLPGSASVETQIEDALAQGLDVSIIHIQLRDFNTYVDQVGFTRAESIVAKLGELLLGRVREHSAEHPFLGHLGGTDFIAVVMRDQVTVLVEDAIAEFAKQRGELDKREHQTEPLHIVAGVVHSQGLNRGALDTLTNRLGAALQSAKDLSGSSFVIWQGA